MFFFFYLSFFIRRCHWQYDPVKLKEIVGGRDVAFYEGEPLCNPFYTVSPGASTCYGDQLVCVAASLAESSPALDVENLAAKLRARFTAEDYKAATPLKKAYNYGDDQKARSSPIQGPWIHGSIEKFLSGDVSETDTSADALMRMIPVAALAAVAGWDDATLEQQVDAVVRVTQLSQVARNHAILVAKALVAVIHGDHPKDGLQAVLDAASSEANDDSSAKTVATALTAAASHENYAASIEVLRSGLGLADANPSKFIN